MERCKDVSDVPEKLEKFRQRTKYCLRLLHSLNIIHHDVKPSNIVYSPSLKEFVLIDFGISHTLA